MVLPRQVQEILGVRGGIALDGDVSGSARIKVILRDGDVLLKIQRRFNHGGDQTRAQMPLDVAVEQPNPWLHRVLAMTLDHNVYRLDLPGLSALNRRTKLASGQTTRVSRRIGILGKSFSVTPESSKMPLSSGPR